jgi:hypothetical protein
MAQYTIEIPDEYIPGVVATAHSEQKNPEEVVQEYALMVATKACQDLKVGPYYSGPIPPQFNQDGSPYVIESVVEEEVITEEPIAE